MWSSGKREQRRKRSESVVPPRPRGTNGALVEEFEGKADAMWVDLMRGWEHYGEYGTWSCMASEQLDLSLTSRALTT